MLIKELLDDAMEYDQTDIKALIMLVVFDKKVAKLDDDVKELNIYFMQKHRKRMIKELNAYKEKMNMNKTSYWKVYTKEKVTLYIYAKNESQAKNFATSLRYMPLKTVYVPDNEIMSIRNTNVPMGSLKAEKTPYLIGLNKVEQQYKVEGLN